MLLLGSKTVSFPLPAVALALMNYKSFILGFGLVFRQYLVNLRDYAPDCIFFLTIDFAVVKFHIVRDAL